MRVVIYTRVSTRKKKTVTGEDEQEYKRMVQDTENQANQLRDFAKARGWIIAHEYTDRASGKTAAGRVQFTQMMADARKRQFDMVLFWALDRFSREGTLPSLIHLADLAASGVDFCSYQEQYLASLGPFKDAIIGLLAAIAKAERERIVTRIRAGMDTAAKKGKFPGRPFRKLNEQRIRDLAAQGWGFERIAHAMKQPPATIRRRMKKLGLGRYAPDSQIA